MTVEREPLPSEDEEPVSLERLKDQPERMVFYIDVSDVEHLTPEWIRSFVEKWRRRFKGLTETDDP